MKKHSFLKIPKTYIIRKKIDNFITYKFRFMFNRQDIV